MRLGPMSRLGRIVPGLCLLASQIAFGQTFGSITGETRDVICPM